MTVTETSPQSSATDKRPDSFGRLVILVALALAAGRIAVVSRDGVTAFLSANDRSRWSTVASLVEHGTYVIDTQEAIVVRNPYSKKDYRPWSSIDKVRHTGKDGRLHYYSSKPPLYPTMVAGLYAVVRAATGMTLTDQPLYMTRVMLALVNLPLLAIFYAGTWAAARHLCREAWSSRFLVISVCLATMVLPFATSLNNHLPAAAATAAVMWIYVAASRRLEGVDPISVPRWWWAAAGFAAAFAVANELPALSMLGLWGILFLLLSRKSVLPFLLGAFVVAFAFFGTNWIAHQSWRPPYAHRGIGATIAQWDGTEGGTAPWKQKVEALLRAEALLDDDDEIMVQPSDESGRWVVQVDETLYAVVGAEPGSDDTEATSGWTLAHWDDWYEYPRTHWKPENLKGVDRGESSRLAYLANMTIGHHGVFSLTPIWVLIPFGLIALARSASVSEQRLAWAVAISTLVCAAFYLSRPVIDRNYGGVSTCFRWLLWFAPLWLWAASAAIDRGAASGFRRAALVTLLALSVFSVSTALDSPWQHPWLYRFWDFLGWIS